MLWTPSSGRLSYGQTELIHTIRRCGLTSGLKLCLDAGDAASYSGSGQSWLDTSGNGYDFFRGATSGAEASDPTFNGTAGRRSSGEYWSVDGGDYFKYDSANETWMNNLHKDNAKFTVMGWVYLSSSAGSCPLFVTAGLTWSEYGYSHEAANGGTQRLVILNNVVGGALQASGAAVTTGVWQFHAVSIDEAAATGLFVLNSTVASFTSTYNTPGSASASFTASIGSINGSYPLANGSRLGLFAAWEGVALTQGQLMALYHHTRGRFGV